MSSWLSALPSWIKTSTSYLLTSSHGRTFRSVWASLRHPRLSQQGHFFHRLDDPLSHLALEVLASWWPESARPIQVHLLGPRTPLFYPNEAQFLAWAYQDAPRLAPVFGRPEWPKLRQPDAATMCALGSQLMEGPLTVERVLIAGRTALTSRILRPTSDPALKTAFEAHQAASDRLIKRLGHYAAGSLWFKGSWYAGVDRQTLLMDQMVTRIDPTRTALPRLPLERFQSHRGRPQNHPLNMYLSVRSPYSYLAYRRVRRLCEHYGIELRVHPILPMVNRGIPLPVAKTFRIIEDCTELARAMAIPFGPFCDPLGKGIDNTYAIWWIAAQHELDIQWLDCALSAAWAEGKDLSKESTILELGSKIGLDTSDMKRALARKDWVEGVARNMERHGQLNFWGAPSFEYNGQTFWGQDRLVLLENTFLHGSSMRGSN